jgi:hypothetical protein
MKTLVFKTETGRALIMPRPQHAQLAHIVLVTLHASFSLAMQMSWLQEVRNHAYIRSPSRDLQEREVWPRIGTIAPPKRADHLTKTEVASSLERAPVWSY